MLTEKVATRKCSSREDTSAYGCYYGGVHDDVGAKEGESFWLYLQHSHGGNGKWKSEIDRNLYIHIDLTERKREKRLSS